MNNLLNKEEEVKNFLRVLVNKKVSSSIKVLDLNFLNEKDSKGNTILHNAVLQKDILLITDIISVVNLVNDTGMKDKFLNITNNDGNTALHLAAYSCQQNNNDLSSEAIAKLLDNAGCKKTIPNNKGLIVSSSESPPPSASEYSKRLFSMFGGQQSPTNSTKSSNSSFEIKKSTFLSFFFSFTPCIF
jgi:hypothetical protein